MKDSIIRTIQQEALRAYNSGKMWFVAYGFEFFVEEVVSGHCRVVNGDNVDVGVRIDNGHVYCG